MFGWVDFSDLERKRTSEIMNLVRYPGAIDELGLGVLRDNFANRLFPATSTLHTHARYYYLVSYLMKDIERSHAGKPLHELRGILREGEMRTARRLIEWERKQPERIGGITGRDSLDSGWVKMTPASMDWAAIQRLKLLRNDGVKLAGFLRMVSASSKGSTKEMRSEFDSESPVDFASGSLWDVPWSSYVHWDEGDELSLWLTREEASDLKSRIQKLFPDTAYAILLDHPAPDALWAKLKGNFGSTSFIRLMDGDTLSELSCTQEVAELAETAANLSALASVLHIRFNHLLRRRACVTPFEEDEACTRWASWAYSDTQPYHRRATGLDLGRAFQLSGTPLNNGRNFETYRFLQAAQDAYASEDLDTLDELIEKREKSLKGEPRSKIANAKAYSAEWFGGLELTYRLEVALMVTSEIHMALGGGDD